MSLFRAHVATGMPVYSRIWYVSAHTISRRKKPLVLRSSFLRYTFHRLKLKKNKRQHPSTQTSMNVATANKPMVVQYNCDENGNGTGAWNSAPKLPPHLAKRLAATKKAHAKKGTPAEREAAVAARRQAVLEEKKNKARKHIEQCESYMKKKQAIEITLEQQEAGEESQEAKK